MNTPVSFKLARLLKEEGFNEPCWNSYFRTAEGKEVLRRAGVSFNKYNDTFYCEPYHMGDKGRVYYYILAPNISDVVMWLYEKYNIWVECYWDTVNIKEENELNWYFAVSRVGDIESPNIGSRDLNLEFKFPIESYEAAIEYVLNNLIKDNAKNS